MTERDDARSTRAGWLRPTLLTVLLGAVPFGCKQEPPSVTEESAGVATQAASQSAAAKAKFDEEAFSLEMTQKGAYAAGKEAEVEIHLNAKSGFKCNDKYPYKFKAVASPDITYASEVVRKDAVRLEGKHDAYMSVKFTPKSAGEKTIGGKFSFSVCTEDQCLVERRDLALALDVK